MAKRKRAFSSNILIVGVFSLLAVGSWVSFDIYRAIVKTTVPKSVQEEIKPLNPEIDSGLVNSLTSRKKYEEDYLNRLQPKFLLDETGNASATTGQTPTPTPTVTEPTNTKVATNSGEVATNSATLSQ
jgi:hypothetical protein